MRSLSSKVLLCSLGFSLFTRLFAQDSGFTPVVPGASDPILTMDQADYEPGSTASFIGRGFSPFETVTLQVLHADGTSDSGEDHLPWTVVADERGQINSSWHVCEDDCANSVLELTALGQSSGLKADVLFSDGFINNGGFEAASLLGWSVVRSANDPFGNNWYLYSGSFSPLTHNPIDAPPEGTRAVVTDQLGGGYQMLYQDLILEPGYTHTLSFKIYYRNWADDIYIGPTLTSAVGLNQQYRVDVIRTVAPIDSLAPGDVLATLFKTSPGDPRQLPPTTITADLTPLAGSTVRLRFAVVESVNIFNGSVDDVKLVSTPRQCLSMDSPSDVVVNAEPGQCSAAVNFALPVPVSQCPGVTVSSVTSVPPSGSRFSVGTTQVKCTATDSAGNSIDATFNVTVKDAEPPVITLAPVAELKPNPNGLEIANAFGFATVSDNCSSGLVPNGTIQPEQGTGCTRSVTKTWIVSDAAGNTATGSQTITFIRDTEKPVITLSPAAPLGYNPSDAEIAAAFGSATVTDNCSSGLVATGVIGAEQGSSCTRSVTKTWSVTDAAGNAATASQTVTFVRDTEKPVITISPAASLGINPTDADIAAAFGAATVTDNCSPGLVATGVIGQEQGTGCSRSITKVWSVTDAAGNSAVASQTLVFTRDTEPPVITLSAAASLPNNPTDAQIAGAFGLATVSDNCTSAAVVQESIGPEQVTGCARSVTKTWTATDAAGNASSVSQTINFARDTQPPSIAALSGPVAPIPVGSSASISTTVSDECSGVGSVTVDWGDGGKSTIANPSSAFSTAHIYSTPGIYAVHLSATDRSGNEAGADFRYVVVYDPASGSATGGGMITSKAGSYLPNPSLTGKAIFAFVCKYRNGSSLPVGQTFFRANELNFHSDSYAWLIISGGRAQFKGQGTLNGVAGYSFVVTVQDGKACGGAGDKFRLELWNGSQKIYDNVWDAPDSLDTGTLEDISQGSIVLH